MPNYTKSATLSQKLIEDAGQPITVCKESATIDKITGEETNKVCNSFITSAVILPFEDKQFGTNQVKTNGLKVLLGGNSESVAPDDTLQIGEVRYKVGRVKTLSPGGTKVLQTAIIYEY